MRIKTEVAVEVAAPKEVVFEYATNPKNFPKFFKGAGPIPAVTKIENTNGEETRAGTIRKVTSSDGAVMMEEMIEFDPPEHQRYILKSGIKAPLSFLVKSGGGEWDFLKTKRGTMVIWRFHFELSSPVVYPIGALLVKVFFKTAMMRCLKGMREGVHHSSLKYLTAAGEIEVAAKNAEERARRVNT